MSSSTSKESYHSYETIKLRDYFTISLKGEYYKLQLTGTPNIEKCKSVWEEIVKKNCEENGSAKYFKYVDDYKVYNILISQYLLVKGYLLRLAAGYDPEVAEKLKKMGYPLNTLSVEKYRQSLLDMSAKSNNLLSKIKMKKNELANYQTDGAAMKDNSFEKAMAKLVGRLKIHWDNDITLAAYNALRSEANEIERLKTKVKQ
jgi:hypothetical protein